MKLLSLYKQGKLESKLLTTINIPQKINLKTIFLTMLTTVLISLPIIFLVVSLLIVYSPVRVMFWITLIFIFMMVVLIFSFISVLNVLLLKNYLDDEELKKVDTKAIFVYELLNPWIILVGLSLDIIIITQAL